MPGEAIEELNARFAIPGEVAVAAGPGGLPVVTVRNTHATATIALQGATVTGFQPHGPEPVLWVSRQAVYAEDKAIRGGIPLCWPWFGAHPSDPTKPAHGFVRTRPWTLMRTAGASDGATEVRLGLSDDEATRALWPHAFALELVVTVGPALRVRLIARNTGATPFVCGGALHSYFRVGDVTAIAIEGLDGCAYVDQVDERRLKTQHGAVTIVGETDRVYQDITGPCTIEDPVLRRRITVAKDGSRTTVVWNPWQEKARRLADFGDDEYPRMVCVEVANAPGDTATVAPGGEHALETAIGVEAQ
jgi:glucose-6-phosphate 1-epimerase